MLPPKMALPALVFLMSFAIGFPTLVSAYSIYDQVQGCVSDEDSAAKAATLAARCDTTSVLFNILDPGIAADVDLLYSRRFTWPPVLPYMDPTFPYMNPARVNAFLSSLDADLGQNEPQVSWKDFQLGFNYFAAADTAVYYGKFGLSSPNMLFRFSNIDSVREKNHIDIYLNHVHDPWAGVDHYPARDCNNQPCPDREEDGDPTQCDEYSGNAVQSSAGHLAIRGGPDCSNNYCVSYVEDPNWYLGAHPTNQRINHEVQHLFYASRTESLLWGPSTIGFPNEMLSMANEYLEGAASPDSARPIWNNVYDWPLIDGPPWPRSYVGIAYSHYYLWMTYLAQQFAGDPSEVEDDLLYKYVHYRDGEGKYNNSMYGLARVLDDGAYGSLGGSGSVPGDERLRNLFHNYALAKWINAPPSFNGGRLGFSHGLVPSLTPGFFDNSFNPCARASAVEVPPRFLVGPARIATDSVYAFRGIWSATDTGQDTLCIETRVSYDTVAVWLYGTDYIQFDADPSFESNGKQNTFSFKMNWNVPDYPGGGSRNSLRLSAVSYSVSGDSLYRKGAFATQVVDACIDTVSGTAEIRVPDFGSATKSVVIAIDLGEEYPQAPSGGTLLGRKFYYGYRFGVDTTSVQSQALDLMAFRPTGSNTDSLSWTDPQGHGVTGYYIQRSAGTPDNPVTIDSTGCRVYGKSLSPLFGDAVRFYRVVSRENPLIVSNLATTGGVIDQSQTLLGDLYVSGDVTVALGKTVDVLPGARIHLRPNFDSKHMGYDASKIELLVDGTVRAVGTSADSIIWQSAGNPPTPGDWRGFRFQGSDSSSRLEFNVIRHAVHGLITNVAPRIDHSRIQHSQFYGIWADGVQAKPLITYTVLEQNHGAELASTGYAYVRVRHCNLRYSSALGQGAVDDGAVYTSSGSGILRYSSVTGVGMGLYCVGYGANPILQGESSSPIDSLKYGRNNILDFQSYGVRTYDGALPELGTPNSSTNWAAGRNNIYTTVAPAALYVSHSGTVTLNAKHNYWGSNPPDLSKFSGPINGPQIPSRYLTTFETQAGSGFLPAARLPGAEELYVDALGKELASDLLGAAADYEGIIASYPDDPAAVRSLSRLVPMQVRRGKGVDEIAYVDRIRTSGASRDLQNAAKRMMPQLLIHTGNTAAGLSAYDELLASPDFDRAGLLLEMAFQKGVVLYDSVGAKAAVSELQKVCSDRFILKHARAMLQDVVGPDTWVNAAGPGVSQKTSPAPAFELDQNRPNPSNPITTFSFSVPSTGAVALRIFDVHGRLVRTIATGTYGAGRHSVQWDGTDDRGRHVASGVYHYQLAALGKVLSRKLLLLK